MKRMIDDKKFEIKRLQHEIKLAEEEIELLLK